VIALDDLRREGKIAAIGLSNVSVAQIDRAREVAPIAAVQNHLSVEARADMTTVRACEERGIAYLAYSPLHVGDGRFASRIDRIAASHGISPQRVRIAWLRAVAPQVMPLVGASRPQSIADSVLPVDLDNAEIAVLNAPPIERT
jgi:aryl-alcohol dehydrogenase-like predicted oxidoreductase